MSKKKNPFESLVDIYRKQVQESDEKGFAEKFATCTEKFFEQLKYNISQKFGYEINFVDIQYLDGYFIFGYGTNSVVHFKIDTCPEWLFAIWWDEPYKITINGVEQYPNYVKGSFFTQFEETIDKFKPSCSEICYHFTINPDDNVASTYNLLSITDVINFMHDHNEMAFCRDYCGWNYNEEFHTEEEAKEKYEKYKSWKNNKDKYSALNDKKILDFIKCKVLPRFTEAEIIDKGDNWSPRYDLMAPMKGNGITRPGCYDWFETDDVEGQAIIAEFEKLKQECERVADEYEFCWFTPIDPSIIFYKKDKKK